MCNKFSNFSSDVNVTAIDDGVLFAAIKESVEVYYGNK